MFCWTRSSPSLSPSPVPHSIGVQLHVVGVAQGVVGRHGRGEGNVGRIYLCRAVGVVDEVQDGAGTNNGLVRVQVDGEIHVLGGHGLTHRLLYRQIAERGLQRPVRGLGHVPLEAQTVDRGEEALVIDTELSIPGVEAGVLTSEVAAHDEETY